MKRAIFVAPILLAAAAAWPIPAAATDGHAEGQVADVLIQVRTAEGVKWYRIGKNLERVEVKPGDRVRFDYADDTIEAISVDAEGKRTNGEAEAPEKPKQAD